ncbi:hypothetical protein MTE01_30310 [Microbacterium testaceum]|uniref:Uncharacterized protein n=1 Tax=Microbacterium testaceum TaxID=2033 RepID=A0A4Y3QNR4_MICTE|nr:hypothetical protein MTE01_30310 [Microbacterium testaceum]
MTVSVTPVEPCPGAGATGVSRGSGVGFGAVCERGEGSNDKGTSSVHVDGSRAVRGIRDDRGRKRRAQVVREQAGGMVWTAQGIARVGGRGPRAAGILRSVDADSTGSSFRS